MQKKFTVDTGYPYKIWKTKPPGEEQRELNRLFEEGKISESMTADFVREKWHIFQSVSPKVFATHFRTTKAKFGRNLQTGSSQNMDRKESSAVQHRPSVTIKNPPIVTYMHADHEKKLDFVVVVMAPFSGTHDFKFKLSDDGASVTVTYTWPLALYTPELLFEDLPKTHPMVQSFTSYLLQAGITGKSEPPQGSMTVKLPCRVQREISDFKNCIVVDEDDTKLIMMEFVAYHTYFRPNYYDH
ncbi:uncharacterized protein LOC119071302 [Bradysia coprophila]|uniref:uncharacterized protein LOC119071302 n=1 Tax=Bradysia coprophila TaxID=38358 RepID=UPI00187D7C04|nr:uncharacterized protein LOC119071302 [Bradysia coprophila]